MPTLDITAGKRGDTLMGKRLRLLLEGVAYDLTGASIRIQVRPTAESPKILLEWSTAAGTITLADAATGYFDRADMKLACAAGRHVYDIEFKLPSGRVLTTPTGTFTVEADVTR